MALRTEAEQWLTTQGTDQWSDPETGARAIDKWRQSIDEGRSWVIVDADGGALATVSRGPVDRDFWHDSDGPETALYLYKLIVARKCAGTGLGGRVLDWAAQVAALEGRAWVRIDVWRTNTGLQSYYERNGFTHVRTESPSHRRSGWLAQRPTAGAAMPNLPLAVGDPALWLRRSEQPRSDIYG